MEQHLNAIDVIVIFWLVCSPDPTVLDFVILECVNGRIRRTTIPATVENSDEGTLRNLEV